MTDTYSDKKTDHYDVDSYRMTMEYQVHDDKWHWQLEEYCTDRKIKFDYRNRSLPDAWVPSDSDASYFHGVDVCGSSKSKERALKKGNKNLRRLCKIIQKEVERRERVAAILEERKARQEEKVVVIPQDVL